MQLDPARQTHIACAIVAHKASIGLADMSDESVIRQAATIYEALLVVCATVERDLAAGDPTAPPRQKALQWFVEACLDRAEPATVN